ncbi:uncharacterized protein [Palaemon carinicauda]|uniref:uncharacterized protein n=1 Tax=Palaemon carinicauda TaxID=392227 RepID=UPI0035B62BBF
MTTRCLKSPFQLKTRKTASPPVEGNILEEAVGAANARIGNPPAFPPVGGCLHCCWKRWMQLEAEHWTIFVIRSGYHVPFIQSLPTLIKTPLSTSSYAKGSTEGLALRDKVLTMLEKSTFQELLDDIPRRLQSIFLVKKASGGWRPVIGMSALNKFVKQTPFSMETADTFRQAVKPQDFMCTLDLKDTYFQIPIHSSSRKYLRFNLDNKKYHFKELCFGLSTALQVFTQVFALVSSWAHRIGICLLHYLDD